MYTTLEKIIGQISTVTVLQLSDDSDAAIVTDEMLEAAAAGGDLTGYTADGQAAIAVCLVNINEAIANADAVIDGYSSGRYVVPFNPVPAIIAKCSLDIAIYNLYARRVETMPEVRDKNYVNTLKLLQSISKGDVNLGATATAPASDSARNATAVSQPRQFTRDTLRGL
ncbi:MAG: DUF1320 domain-containing protein [Geobacteraceae bacterium]|nr:DUF1320 domain-containing protein [Geobacteraceae bacterium]